MIRKVDYTMHSACLAAVVTIGDAIIYLPSEYRGEAMLPGFLIASAAAVLIFLASHFLCVYSSGGAIYKKVLFTVLALILSVYALRSGAHCLLVFAGFADKILLPDGGKFIAAFIFSFHRCGAFPEKQDCAFKAFVNCRASYRCVCCAFPFAYRKGS